MRLVLKRFFFKFLQLQTAWCYVIKPSVLLTSHLTVIEISNFRQSTGHPVWNLLIVWTSFVTIIFHIATMIIKWDIITSYFYRTSEFWKFFFSLKEFKSANFYYTRYFYCISMNKNDRYTTNTQTKQLLNSKKKWVFSI